MDNNYNGIRIKKKTISREKIILGNRFNGKNETSSVERIEYKGIVLPIGYARVNGSIEDFVITICDKENNKFEFWVKDGNICECDMKNVLTSIEYEVK